MQRVRQRPAGADQRGLGLWKRCIVPRSTETSHDHCKSIAIEAETRDQIIAGVQTAHSFSHLPAQRDSAQTHDRKLKMMLFVGDR